MRITAHSARTVAAFLLSVQFLSSCAGHLLPAGMASNYSGEFDFRSPPCKPRILSPGPGQLGLQYLGVGGVLIGTTEAKILGAPFFSNPSKLRVLFRRFSWNYKAIADGMRSISGEHIDAIVLGHSHYDHVGDLPIIATEYFPHAALLMSPTAAHMLAAYDCLASRIRLLDDGSWQEVNSDKGVLVARVCALRSTHAPQFAGLHLFNGELGRPWMTDWTGRRFTDFVEGEVAALILDFVDGEGTIAWRVYYQDTASTAAAALLEALVSADGRPVDVAILCVANWHEVPDYPNRILSAGRAKQVVAIHYENFFEPWSTAPSFAPSLTNRQFVRFLERCALLRGPLLRSDSGCGPRAARFTVPLPGDTVIFDAQSQSAL